jgi:hypothetical protein
VLKFSEVMTIGWKLIGPSRLFGWPGVKLSRVFSRMVRPGVTMTKSRTPSAIANSSIAPARMYVLPTPVAESMTASNGGRFPSTS